MKPQPPDKAQQRGRTSTRSPESDSDSESAWPNAQPVMSDDARQGDDLLHACFSPNEIESTQKQIQFEGLVPQAPELQRRSSSLPSSSSRPPTGNTSQLSEIDLLEHILNAQADAAIEKGRIANLEKLLELGAKPGEIFQASLPALAPEVRVVFSKYGYAVSAASSSPSVWGEAKSDLPFTGDSPSRSKVARKLFGDPASARPQPNEAWPPPLAPNPSPPASPYPGAQGLPASQSIVTTTTTQTFTTTTTVATTSTTTTGTSSRANPDSAGSVFLRSSPTRRGSEEESDWFFQAGDVHDFPPIPVNPLAARMRGEEVLIAYIRDRPLEMLIAEESQLIWQAAQQPSTLALQMLMHPARGIACYPFDLSISRGWHEHHCPFAAAIQHQQAENLRFLLANGISPGDRFKEGLPHQPGWVKDMFRTFGYML